MRRLLCAAALVAALPLGAQMPGPGVEFLLARTGTLQLTDQQVVKLAAIARRAADRHKAMRASFDSLHAQFRRGDSAQRHREGPPAQLMPCTRICATPSPCSRPTSKRTPGSSSVGAVA
jgi:hypothetical protein